MSLPFFEELRARLAPLHPIPLPQYRQGLRDSAVLIPLLWSGGEPHVVLVRRSQRLRSHPGQIGFPGGGYERGDGDLLATALRESNEEVGIDSTSVRLLGRLPTIATITGYRVTAFVGVIPDERTLEPAASEIDAVLYAPLMRLARTKRPFFGLPRSALIWGDGGDIVWGITGSLLEALLVHAHAAPGSSAAGQVSQM